MGIKTSQSGTQPWQTSASQVTAQFSYTAKTPVSVVGLLPCAGFPFIGCAFVPAGNVTGGGTVAIEGSCDGGASWFLLYGIQQATAGNAAVGQISAAFAIATTGVSTLLMAPAGTTHVRVRLTVAFTGTGAMQVQLGAASAGSRPDVYVSGFGASITNNMTQIASLTITPTTLAIQASQVSAIVNGTTSRTTTTGLGIYKTLDVILNVTAAGVATGVLQVFLEDSVDGGTTWDDVVAFNTFAFGASLAVQRASINGFLATSRSGTAVQQVETLAAGTIRQGPFGDRIRVREVISGVSGSPTGATYRLDAIAKG